jgi:hypothetical protein
MIMNTGQSVYSKIISDAVYALSWKNKSHANIVRTFAIGLPVKLKRIIINRMHLIFGQTGKMNWFLLYPQSLLQKMLPKMRESNDTNRVFVVPNFPTMFEVKDFGKLFFINAFPLSTQALYPRPREQQTSLLLYGPLQPLVFRLCGSWYQADILFLRIEEFFIV